MSIILTALGFFIGMGLPLNLIPIKMFGSVDAFSLMAIPFFIIAGNIMAYSNITDKIVSLSDAMVGQFKGSLADVTTVASAFFGGIQGSGVADAAAIGGMMIPAMEKQGYEKDFAVAVMSGAAMLSPIIPPSIAMILYSYYTQVPIGALFMGGLLPGIIITVFELFTNGIMYRKRKYNFSTHRFSLKRLGSTFIHSIWELLMPVIIIVGIISGVVTATEAGVVAIAYGLIYGFFISKKLKFSDFPKILVDSAVTTAVVMITISAAGVLSNVLVRLRFQNSVAAFVINGIQNPYLGTLFLFFIIFVLGMFLDPTVLIAMLATTILTIGRSFGFNPIHYGVVLVMMMQLGAITPPVGSFWFVSCGIANIPLENAVKPLIPYIFTVLLVIILALFIPPMVTLIPNLLGLGVS